MKMTFRKTLLAALMSIAVIGSARSSVITSDPGIKYGATLTTANASLGGSLKLTIDALSRFVTNPPGDANNDLQYAIELDKIEFRMKKLTGVTITAAMFGSESMGVSDWVYNFIDTDSNDFATFTAVSSNHTALTKTSAFDFKFVGTGLDFSSLRLTTDYLTYTPKTRNGVTTYMYGTENDKVDLAVTTNVVPEPASLAMMAAGLGMLGIMRRRKTTYALLTKNPKGTATH
jgi:hypothetical protein